MVFLWYGVGDIVMGSGKKIGWGSCGLFLYLFGRYWYCNLVLRVVGWEKVKNLWKEGKGVVWK